ncbi:hypothetical protein GCM10010994_31990 [Chelatococcus reniformis]|uniref:Uncharacterized protein n=1 Tax=Chelatococcus reniformis TaxID=1494448 RepID=A0A916UEU4_9HYPH|nr:hypothetical protein GCM10010994_31990 [Chelatococcus reniformis]
MTVEPGLLERGRTGLASGGSVWRGEVEGLKKRIGARYKAAQRAAERRHMSRIAGATLRRRLGSFAQPGGPPSAANDNSDAGKILPHSKSRLAALETLSERVLLTSILDASALLTLVLA